MGIFRKTMSVGTAGLVSYRNDNERSAKYAKQTRNAARAQVAQNAAQLDLQRQQLTATDYGNVQNTVQQMPQQVGGWYPDQRQPGMLRWFDGQQWTAHTRPQ